MDLETIDERAALKEFARLTAEIERREQASLYEGDLSAFVEAAWPFFDGSSQYQKSWALDALCEHLTAVTRGDIKRLLINYPPRGGKSSVASIAWPAWTWIQQNRIYTSGPQVQFLCASYGHSLSLQLSNKSRRLLVSPFFQRYWADRFELRGDQNAKHQYDNSAGGSRIATSVTGGLLGIGGAILIADDLHNTEQVESEAERDTVLRFWREFRSTRLNDPKQAAIVAVMQRLHEEDVSGAILQDTEKWTHLLLPMRHDPSRHCVTVLKWDEKGKPAKEWEDPRPRDSKDLLWPERFGEDQVRMIEKELGPYMASGRLQQQPTPAGGGIIKREWWQLWEAKDGKFPVCKYRWASADTAYTEKEENDPTGFTCWGLWYDKGQPKIILLNAWRKRLEIHGPNDWVDEDGKKQKIARLPGESEPAWVKRTQGSWGLCEWLAYSCRRFNVHDLLIEGKASGLSVAQELRRLHGTEGWHIHTITPEGDKVARLYAVQPTFAAGLVYYVDRDWSQMVIDEISVAPRGRFMDLTDSSSMALSFVRNRRMLQRPEERAAEEMFLARHQSPSQPLYPGT